MATTNKRLSGPAALTGVAATKYTVPAATVTILQHIHVTNPTGSSITFTMSIGADAAGVRIYDAVSIPAGSMIDTFCKYVLNPTEILQAFSSSTAAVLTLNGQELSAG
jgi:hypothetical protein